MKVSMACEILYCGSFWMQQCYIGRGTKNVASKLQ